MRRRIGPVEILERKQDHAGATELRDSANDRLGDAAGQLVRRLQGVRRPIDAEPIETRPQTRNEHPEIAAAVPDHRCEPFVRGRAERTRQRFSNRGKGHAASRLAGCAARYDHAVDDGDTGHELVNQARHPDADRARDRDTAHPAVCASLQGMRKQLQLGFPPDERHA